MRVGVFRYLEFHEPIVRPIYELLRHKHECIYATHFGPLFDFRPHVVVMGEAIFDKMREELPDALYVHTRHGLASKKITYRGASECDFMCVTSEYMRDWYLAAGARPRREFWISGYTQLDPLLRGDQLSVPFDLDKNRKTVLYSPTYDPPMSSAEMLGERLIELICGSRTDVQIVIKPHPLIPAWLPKWMEMWRGLVARHKHVYLVENARTDIIPFLQAADLMVSDASSVQLQFLGTNRPLILINNPKRFDYSEFDPNGFEWTWRDMAEQIDDVNALPAAVDEALSNPSLRADRRAHYRKLLFGDLTDGRAAERIAANIDKLAPRFPASGPLFKATWLARRGARRARRFLPAKKALWERPAA